MTEHLTIVISRRTLVTALIVGIVAVTLFLSNPISAQKVQEDYGDKFKIAEGQGGISVAASSDGRYVIVAGKNGVIVSDDYGKTGTWTQTVRMK